MFVGVVLLVECRGGSSGVFCACWTFRALICRHRGRLTGTEFFTGIGNSCELVDRTHILPLAIPESAVKRAESFF